MVSTPAMQVSVLLLLVAWSVLARASSSPRGRELLLLRTTPQHVRLNLLELNRQHATPRYCPTEAELQLLQPQNDSPANPWGSRPGAGDAGLADKPPPQSTVRPLHVSMHPAQYIVDDLLKPTTTAPQSFLRSLCQAPRGVFSHPLDCRKFVDCWDGRVREKYCPDNQVFSDLPGGFCDYLEYVECGERPVLKIKPSSSELSATRPSWGSSTPASLVPTASSTPNPWTTSTSAAGNPASSNPWTTSPTPPNLWRPGRGRQPSRYRQWQGR